MPAVLAHWAVAKDVAWRFINGKKTGCYLFQGKSNDQYEKISRYVYLGASGPDLPYCRDRSGTSKWADLFHYNKQGEFLLELVLVAKKTSDRDRRDRAMAYALGHVTHIAADSMVHPYVNCFAGAYHAQVIADIHKTSECHQDSYLAKQYYGRSNIHSGSSWRYFVPPLHSSESPPGHTGLHTAHEPDQGCPSRHR
ncbi:zinc dependent phospholipase C family protein [Acidobacteriota bacterium]